MADRHTVIDGDQILDATVTEDELNASVAGDGLSGGAGTALAFDLNELTQAVVDVAADFITIEDVSDTNASRKESIADLVSAMAGTGLTATNGVLSADSLTDNIVEGDIVKDDFTSLVNGATVDFDLGSIPLANSLQVYLNGIYQREGSGFDYELNPDSGDTLTIRFATAPATNAKLVAHFITDN